MKILHWLLFLIVLGSNYTETSAASALSVFPKFKVDVETSISRQNNRLLTALGGVRAREPPLTRFGSRFLSATILTVWMVVFNMANF